MTRRTRNPNPLLVHWALLFLLPCLALFACVTNAPPTADDQSLTTSEDTPIAITLTGSDAEGNDLTYTVRSDPTNGVLTGTTPQLTYTPNQDYAGIDAFTFKTNDGVMHSAEATVGITIDGVNDPPVATDQAHATPVGTPLDVTITCTDADGDALTYTVVGGPEHGVLTGDAPYLTYTPDPDFEGTDTFDFKANDGTVDSDVATVMIEVGHNDPPTAIALDNASIPENQPAGTTVGVFTTIDPDPVDTHTYSLVAGAGDEDNASFSISSDQLQSATPLDFENAAELTIRVRSSDSQGNTLEQAFTITVTDQNDPPHLVPPDDQVVIRNTRTPNQVSVAFEAGDQDGDAVTITAISSDQAVVSDDDLDPSCAAGVCTLEFTPEATSNAVITVALTATDGIETVQASFEVNVTAHLVTATSDAGSGSLRDTLGAAVAGDVVGFDPAAFPTNLGYPTVITLGQGQLVLDQDVTIEGAGRDDLDISGGGSSRVIEISAGVSASISGVTITDGIGGPLCRADRYFACGGGIYMNAGSSLTLTAAEVSYNTAISGTGPGQRHNGRGGAIYNDGGTLTVGDSSIVHNTSNGGAGGILATGDSTVIIKDSAIHSNIADYDGGPSTTYVTTGGGIANSGKLTIDNSVIADNTAYLGGGIHNSGDLTVVASSTINGNSVIERGRGGGIANYGTATITDSTIADNSNGGGIYNAGTLLLDGSSIVGNSGNDSDGGGIHNAGGDDATLTVDNSVVEGNSADGGGGIYNGWGGTTTVQNNSSIRNNTAGGGGGIRNEGALIIDSSGIDHNAAQGSGGGISSEGGTIIIRNNSTVSDNAANLTVGYGRGGGLWIQMSGDVTIEQGSTIRGNRANDGGGIYYACEIGDLTISDSTIESNTADNDGGGIYNFAVPDQAACMATLDNSTVSSNTAGNNGGGIFNAPDSTLTLENGSTITTNTAGNDGGGIFNDGGTLDGAVAGGNVSANTPNDIVVAP